MSEYSHTLEFELRYRDLDPMGHVNNAVYVTYLEHARAAYFRDVIGITLDSIDSVLATVTVDYRAPIELSADTATIKTRVPELGTSSIPMEYAISAAGELAATAETVQVVIDGETEQSRPIPEDWRETIEAYEGF